MRWCLAALCAASIIFFTLHPERHPTVIYRAKVYGGTFVCAEVARDTTQPLCITVDDVRALITKQGFPQPKEAE